jgi:hypothetical protein
MAVRQLGKSTILQGLPRGTKIWDQFVTTSDYDLLSTVTLTTEQASVTFSDLGSYSSTYRHLQIKWTARGSGAGATYGIYSRLNSDSNSNYNGHYLVGNGSGVVVGAVGTANYALTGVTSGAGATANIFGAGVIDLLDTYQAKNKTFRTLSGTTGGSRVDLHSALWMSTASVTSWTILPETGNFVQYSRFSLYGIKG